MAGRDTRAPVLDSSLEASLDVFFNARLIFLVNSISIATSQQLENSREIYAQYG